MNKLIKTMPLMAILLGAGIFTVNAALDASQVQTDQEWTLDPNGDQSNPEDYTLAPTGSISDCANADATVCAVVAPEDPSNAGRPLFSQEIQDELDSPTPDHSDIYKGPKTP